MKPKISAGKCITCSECVLSCPTGAITISNSTGKAVIHYKKCNGCGMCIDICPVRAIKE